MKSSSIRSGCLLVIALVMLLSSCGPTYVVEENHPHYHHRHRHHEHGPVIRGEIIVK
jgi:hypothetical protein